MAEAQPVEGRTYPILLSPGDRRLYPLLPLSVPWGFVESPTARRQAQTNHSQSLERLAERGGLSPVEMIAVIDGKEYPWREHRADPKGYEEKAVAELLRRVGAYYRAAQNPIPVALGWLFACSLCSAAGSYAWGTTPETVTCSFCKAVYKPVYPVQPKDAATPPGAGDTSNGNGNPKE